MENAALGSKDGSPESKWLYTCKCRHCLWYSTKKHWSDSSYFLCILSVLRARYGKPVVQLVTFYEQCFPTHSISRRHFQPLQLLNISSPQFPWAVGLITSPRGHFSHLMNSSRLPVNLIPTCVAEKRNVGNGGPTRWDCFFLSPFMPKTTEMGHLVPTKAFYCRTQMQPCCLHPLGAPTHLPCPTLSANAEPISKGHCQKWHNEAESIMTPYVVIGQERVNRSFSSRI